MTAMALQFLHKVLQSSSLQCLWWLDFAAYLNVQVDDVLFVQFLFRVVTVSIDLNRNLATAHGL